MNFVYIIMLLNDISPAIVHTETLDSHFLEKSNGASVVVLMQQ